MRCGSRDGKNGVVTLSGEHWLARVFQPSVAGVNRVRLDRSLGVVSIDPLRVLGGRLAAQVEALGDTGVLTEEQERAALDALENAGIMPEIQSRSVSASEVASAAFTAVRSGSSPAAAGKSAEPPALRSVLAGTPQIRHVDARAVTL